LDTQKTSSELDGKILSESGIQEAPPSGFPDMEFLWAIKTHAPQKEVAHEKQGIYC